MSSICSICLDILVDNKNKKLKCNHTFHKKCIYRWFDVKLICPLCNSLKVFKLRDKIFYLCYINKKKLININFKNIK